ncbi:flagellar basal body-associated protein FliL [Actinoplanes sp. N902-109]|uniref:flagellar basal body-associated FliL family protein n=1 Tax=Actinoplanes sp. (strain N902-109) TaxID=649831 RepID=UPI000329629E|nr:flagellar basal body-associated FliL family protein [Actinoplanes sp. N902-109]AGL21221.1 flagellar basal body-associated protein FliL [Actinoplanes sp. N902-109]
MAKDEKDAAAEAPKKSKKMLFIIIAAVVLLGGGGAGAYFMFFKSSAADAAPKEPEKGVIAAMENAITINLADGHYLKLGFALQETADAGTETVDLSEATDLAIDQYTGMTVAELSTEKGRQEAKEELLKKIEKAYEEEKDKKQIIMDIYFTQFVTQ